MLADWLTVILRPEVIFVAALALLAFGIVRTRKRKLSDRARGEVRAQQAGPTPGDIRMMAEELRALLAELNETSRRIAAQIDNRYQKLESVLAEADAKIKRLEELLEGSVRGGEGSGARGQGSESTDSSTAAPPPERAEPLDPQHRRIYDLADRGHSPREIAQQVGKPPGEVELILNLRGGAATR